MPFQPGQSGNPKGRPKFGEIEKLREALAKRAKDLWPDEDRTFWDHLAEKAFKDTNVMLACLNRLVPVLSHTAVDANLDVSQEVAALVAEFMSKEPNKGKKPVAAKKKAPVKAKSKPKPK